MTEPTADDHVAAFREAMESYGIVFKGELEADGTLHRVHVEGDRNGSRNGWFVMFLDGKPSGAFGCKKRLGDEKIKWTAEGVKPLSSEERRALAEKARADRERRDADRETGYRRAAPRANAMWDAGVEAEHPYLRRKGVAGYGVRVGVWSIESDPDPVTGEIRTLNIPDTLLVPITHDKKIVSLQGIFPSANNPLRRDKDFVKGGRKRSGYHRIGPMSHLPDGRPIVIIGEGYATCADLHAATGWRVLVAFDAGNLQPVAELVRATLPNAVIIIAADNDQWTLKPLANPGVHYATAAAGAVDGIFVIPQFRDLSNKPTDFNDLRAAEGPGEVLAQITAALNPSAVDPPAIIESPPLAADEPPPPEPDDYGDRDHHPDPESERAPARPSAAPVSDDEGGDEDDDDGVGKNPYFTILGHDRDRIFVFQHEMRMIVSRGVADWGEGALTAIANRTWWQMNFREAGKEWKAMAMNAIQRIAFRRGYFDTSMRRGRGAWLDEGRIVYHMGDRLIVDGAEIELPAIKSRFVYEQSKRLPLPAPDPLTNADGLRIVEIFKQFRWKIPVSAALAVGWVALAPACGALGWRPHLWLSGGTGSGKTTLLNFIHFLMNGAAVYAQGNSTEAGVRQKLRGDALPVLFDEGEQNDDRERARMQNVLSLVRQASSESGALTLKGTTGGESMEFLIRSMFCLSSVQVGIKHQADMERVTVLELRDKRSIDVDEDEEESGSGWPALKNALYDLQRDRELPARLMRRSLDLLPITLKNIETFARAAAGRFGTQREGDQYGALLAGAWSLFSQRAASFPEAEGMIDRYRWDEYRDGSDSEESLKALNALMSAQIRVNNGVMITVHEMVAVAAGLNVRTCKLPREDADGILRRHGLKVKVAQPGIVEGGTLLLANSIPALAKLIEDTPYATDLKGQLLRVPGAQRHKQEHFTVTSRCVSVPLNVILDKDAIEAEVAAAAVDLDRAPV